MLIAPDTHMAVSPRRSGIRAVALDPSAADPHLQLGHVLKLQGKIEEAQAAYLRAFALDPSMPYPLQELRGLGWSEAQTAGLRGAVAPNLRDDGIVNQPHPVSMRRKLSLIHRADSARDARQWERAAQLYRKALARNPRRPGVWVQYGHALKESGELRDPDKLAQAEIAYRRGIALDPGVADFYVQLGHVLKLQGKTEEAQSAYLRAFALDPSMPYPLQELRGLGWSGVQAAELRGMLGPDAPASPTSTSGNGTFDRDFSGPLASNAQISAPENGLGRLPGYFPGAVDDNVKARDFAGRGASRIFAHHVEERLLVRVDRDLDHDEALSMRRRAGIQDTEDQGTVDALGLIGLKRWING
jgi:tetratricopeptide (TPR) repeat protein